MPLPDDLLDRAPEEAARLIALAFLADAAAARERLGDPDDDEALHDFRVAVRRLRSTVRAYRDELRKSVTGRSRRRLRKVARATGASRDVEVLLGWLAAQRGSLYSRHRAGATWLRDALQRERVDADAQLGHEASRDFDRLHAHLARALPRWKREVRVGEPQGMRRFSTALAERLRLATDALRARLLDASAATEGIEALHEARIAGKRVRYLLEPAAAMLEGGVQAVKHLKALQDLLGEIHDLDVLGARLARAVDELAAEHQAEREAELAAALAARAAAPVAATEATAGAAVETAPASLDGDGHPAPIGDAAGNGAPAPEVHAADAAPPPPDAPPAPPAPARPDALPGLLALARRARTRRDALHAQAEVEWLGPRAGALLGALDALSTALERRGAAAPEGVEIERKYLLRAVPRIVRDMPYAEIDQGYIPGERLAERVRRVRRGGIERYYRTVKLGAGVVRTEIEEETTAPIFAALWALTHERRVRKRRWAIPDGALTWEIDGFTDRDLALAEVELPHEAHGVTLPVWLAPYVVREVTTEPEYVNRNLARPDAAEPVGAPPLG